jgi:hypothetical protein
MWRPREVDAQIPLDAFDDGLREFVAEERHRGSARASAQLDVVPGA